MRSLCDVNSSISEPSLSVSFNFRVFLGLCLTVLWAGPAALNLPFNLGEKLPIVCCDTRSGTSSLNCVFASEGGRLSLEPLVAVKSVTVFDFDPEGLDSREEIISSDSDDESYLSSEILPTSFSGLKVFFRLMIFSYLFLVRRFLLPFCLFERLLLREFCELELSKLSILVSKRQSSVSSSLKGVGDLSPISRSGIIGPI